ncbi:vacuolar protein sorting-associated protein 35 [Halteromyces radiatus]|uniref:vacuolar protein sorting-associated protein 35 n=1 Tax=Halteromyces radiatus TaxID=101107 RepID=UPI00221FF965|nr:vacuolar protein sorting-associated protein 35 [Halteromyces radiatus]KAI8096910.1 vacuolar protein sorting-associated protein 35 [Halteromyces radiatus]
MASMMNSPAPMEDQTKLLDEVLNVVRIQAHQMNNCLENNKLMDGLKHCSNMLAELRTSALTPKTYYELYMAVFDALRHLTIYLTEAHQAGRHHLADLYELVQYAGNIVPRLYLMITVGSAYMSMPDAPVREIMRDMMEMTRGVQHPIRGLFLRHYLSGMTRDHLPVGEGSGPEGNIRESIEFILTNFTEMNKLWVRLQHQGHSRDREKREAERQELKILVGTNLVRLSQLDGVDLSIYQTNILPGVLHQVVSCRDVIAQEYLMEVITQVFPDEFHLRTLQPFLSATAQLHPKVNVKQIIISLIDRLAAYAAREAEGEEEVEEPVSGVKPPQKVDEANKEQEATDEHQQGDENGQDEVTDAKDDAEKNQDTIKDEGDATEKDESAQDDTTTATVENTEESKPVKKVRGIPQDVELFVVFWSQIVELVKARPDLGIQDLMGLLVSLINLSLSCYPEKLDYVDQILTYAKGKMTEFSDSPDLHSKVTEGNLLRLLQAPIIQYSSVLTLLSLSNYQPLLVMQPFNTRRAIAHSVVQSIRRNETIIETPEDVHGVLELCDVLLRDQKDAPMAPTSGYTNGRGRNEFSAMDQEDFKEEQGWIARIVHLFQSKDEDTQFLLLSAARKQFGDGGERIRYTFPPLIVSAVKLARRYKVQQEQDEIWEKKTSTLFRFIHQVISTLNHKCEAADICLHLFLMAGQSADEIGFEEIAYEFFVEAFSIYEESISESKAQYQAITCIIGALQQTRVFSADNYDTLITKAALHSAKLLKKPDQCRALYLASHLWWNVDQGNEEETGKPIFKEGKRALECLQKALKIADSCMDSVTNVELFVEILNQYIYYFEKGNEAVTVKYLNGLIDLIHTNLNNMDDPDQHPPTANSSSLIQQEGILSDYVRRHFRATLLYLQERKNSETVTEWGAKYDDVDLGDF